MNTYQKIILDFQKKKYGMSKDDTQFSDHDEYELNQQKNELIWIYPYSAGVMLKVIYSLNDSNTEIIKEEEILSKSFVLNTDWEPANL